MIQHKRLTQTCLCVFTQTPVADAEVRTLRLTDTMIKQEYRQIMLKREIFWALLLLQMS